MTMTMNLLAICLVVSSLAATRVWSAQNRQEDHQDSTVIVRDGHRVVVVEYDENGQHNTKVSISPHDHVSAAKNGKERVILQPETIRLPEEQDDGGGDGGGRSAGEVICDAYGKCKEKIGNVFGRAKDRVSEAKGGAYDAKDAAGEAVHKVKDRAYDAIDNAKDGAYSAKDATGEAVHRVKDRAYDAIDNAKDGAYSAKDATGEAVHRVKDRAYDAIDNAKDGAYSAKDATGEAVHRVKDRAYDAIENAKDGAYNAKEAGKDKAYGAKDMIYDAKEAVKDGAYSAKDATGKAVHKVKDGAYDAKEAVKDRAYNAKEAMKDRAYNAKNAIGNAVHNLKDRAYDAKDTVENAEDGDTMSDAVHKAKDRAYSAKEAVKEGLSQRSHDAKESLKDRAYSAKEVIDEEVDLAKETRHAAWRDILSNATRLSEKAEHAAVKLRNMPPERLNQIMGIVNLLGFATAFGMSFWISFISSSLLARALSRHQFGMVQSKLYPVYFKAMAICIGVALFGHLLRQRKRLWNPAEMYQSCNLLVSILMSLTNLFLVEPRATKIMFERMKIEKEEGRGRESEGGESSSRAAERQTPAITRAVESQPVIDPAVTSATACAVVPTPFPERAEDDAIRARADELNSKLKRFNSCSSLLNLLTLMGLTWHLVYLSQQLHD